jgi:hypothetical protein
MMEMNMRQESNPAEKPVASETVESFWLRIPFPPDDTGQPWEGYYTSLRSDVEESMDILASRLVHEHKIDNTSARTAACAHIVSTVLSIQREWAPKSYDAMLFNLLSVDPIADSSRKIIAQSVAQAMRRSRQQAWREASLVFVIVALGLVLLSRLL